MKAADFYSEMRDALGRARQDDLSLDDLKLMVTCGRAWETAGRPDSGPLANAWDAAWIVFEAEQARVALEAELALGIIEEGEKRNAEWRHQQTAKRPVASSPHLLGPFAHVRPTTNALRWAA